MASGQRVPHSALGVEGYVQISSPIRRYVDLLAHHQLKAVLRGEPAPLPFDAMTRIVDRCHDRSVELKGAGRDAFQSWVARWMLQRPERTFRGTVLSFLRQDLGLARVMVEEVQVEALAQVVANAGDTVWLKCAMADPFQPMIRMEQIAHPTPHRQGQAYGYAQPGSWN